MLAIPLPSASADPAVSHQDDRRPDGAPASSSRILDALTDQPYPADGLIGREPQGAFASACQCEYGPHPGFPRQGPGAASGSTCHGRTDFSNRGPKSGQILVFDKDTTYGLKAFLEPPSGGQT